ncbi:DUF99 domain-containing protein [Halobacteriales archaeon QH_2_65_14]|nr:MAG: DUF99 domain-containing protein [Halobacteriales archaeon QH_2_65_14]
MKAGVRTLGIAESYRERRSTLAGAVVRANRVVDGFAFATCTVGGTDSTTAITSLFEDLGREDVRYLLVAGIAPAWFNVVDLHRLHEATGTPVLSVTFEGSEGLERAIREAFDGEAATQRLETYRDQPERRPVRVDGETVYVRSVGLADDEANDVVRTFTHEGGRPEPVRVARLAARGVDSFRRETQ